VDLSELQVLVRGPGLCDRWVWNNHLALLQIENNEPYYFAVLRKFKLVPGCSCLNNHPRGCTPCAYGVSAARFNHCDTLANCGHCRRNCTRDWTPTRILSEVRICHALCVVCPSVTLTALAPFSSQAAGLGRGDHSRRSHFGRDCVRTDDGHRQRQKEDAAEALRSLQDGAGC
jgi:hypothetical protein